MSTTDHRQLFINPLIFFLKYIFIFWKTLQWLLIDQRKSGTKEFNLVYFFFFNFKIISALSLSVSHQRGISSAYVFLCTKPITFPSKVDLSVYAPFKKYLFTLQILFSCWIVQKYQQCLEFYIYASPLPGVCNSNYKTFCRKLSTYSNHPQLMFHIQRKAILRTFPQVIVISIVLHTYNTHTRSLRIIVLR